MRMSARVSTKQDEGMVSKGCTPGFKVKVTKSTYEDECQSLNKARRRHGEQHACDLCRYTGTHAWRQSTTAWWSSTSSPKKSSLTSWQAWALLLYQLHCKDARCVAYVCVWVWLGGGREGKGREGREQAGMVRVRKYKGSLFLWM